MPREYASYGWIITKDRLRESEIKQYGETYLSDSAGVAGPRDIDPALLEKLKGKGVVLNRRKFRLLDDDDIVYYEGYYIGPDNETEFAPLDDFGMPNSGCTSIQYREYDSDGVLQWVTL